MGQVFIYFWGTVGGNCLVEIASNSKPFFENISQALWRHLGELLGYSGVLPVRSQGPI